MKPIIKGQDNSNFCLIQPVDDHDELLLDDECKLITDLTNNTPFLLAAFHVDDWNKDLSPWIAPPVFGKNEFGNGAAGTLTYITDRLIPDINNLHLSGAEGEVHYIIGGYSLSALFALWAAHQTAMFSACSAASPSVWFPGWMEYAGKNRIKVQNVYMSLGDKEEKAKNKILASVGENIRKQDELLESAGANHILEWNGGNHFNEVEIRTARGFAWCLNRVRGRNG